MMALACTLLFLFFAAGTAGAQHLTLNSHLDYGSDSIDGPLITGNDPAVGLASGRPNYVMIYSEGCYNSKRQARRTVALANRYGDRVHFVLVDLDKPTTPAQQQLVSTYYRGSIPDLILTDASGKPIYNEAGEQSEQVLSGLLDSALAARPTLGNVTPQAGPTMKQNAR